jgi:sirohydrochlorin ferrochelatase
VIIPTDLPPRQEIGVIVVDHGSRRRESNDMLLDVVALFQQHSGYAIVEPAHMELAEPSIGAAFDRCIERGARLVVIHPYFLLPGRHWQRDIPALAAEAARKHPGVPFLVTAPLGLHPLMAEIMSQRIEYCLSRLRGDAGPCDVCSERDTCQWEVR